MTTTIEPATRISITLEAQQWNQVLSVLHDGPYRIVAALIATIAEQAQAAANQAPQPLLNGAAAHVPD
jgi:hypothetical protein